jgi:hypothetical protein
MDLEKLLASIEKTRKELYLIGGEKGHLFNCEMIQKSQELDKLLNKYYRALKKDRQKAP